MTAAVPAMTAGWQGHIYIIRYRGYDNYAVCKQAVLAYGYGSYNPNKGNHKGLIPREEYQPFAV